jgi:murein DD-endopeptidase MepM/ murein hydrolase activator NlpD
MKRISHVPTLRSCLALTLILLNLTALSGCSFLFGGKPARYIDYPVHRGDTLYSIGKRFSVSMDELEDINDLDDPSKIRVGQVLKIPYRGQGVGKRPKSESGSEPAPDPKSKKKVTLTQARMYIGKLAWPVPTARLASPFGPRWMNFHEGLDFSAPVGTPVYAAHSGRVVHSDDRLKGYGNLIVIQAPGLLTVYAHNDRNLVRAGERVSKGDLIAEVGETGHATGPHLHFETRIKNSDGKNVAVDPLVFYPRK